MLVSTFQIGKQYPGHRLRTYELMVVNLELVPIEFAVIARANVQTLITDRPPLVLLNWLHPTGTLYPAEAKDGEVVAISTERLEPGAANIAQLESVGDVWHSEPIIGYVELHVLPSQTGDDQYHPPQVDHDVRVLLNATERTYTAQLPSPVPEEQDPKPDLTIASVPLAAGQALQQIRPWSSSTTRDLFLKKLQDDSGDR
ncbi:hypothetical protein GON03_05585 [Nocardioides sp. MAH-18]|uniref:Uncharacterized protein n=1 Tax=Nocardioides agri TaxID=2682843 RepID=A0A6L6XSP0_9ACTN|nr:MULTISPECIES: hypothetical protein [unclassified Nocardioides]MBA2953780.1 hypothetical protein [Nocardioides sp. CGMCC 1.13656]MVQ48645.1 hypothetical protein [Nocardioides sp. MAH-18]